MAKSNQVTINTRINRIVKQAASITTATLEADKELREICAECAAANSVEPLQLLWDKLQASDKVSAGIVASMASHIKHRLLVNVNQDKHGAWTIRTNKVIALEANHAEAPALGERKERGDVAPTKSPVLVDDLMRLRKRALEPTTKQAAGGFYWTDSEGNVQRHTADRTAEITAQLETLAKLMAAPK